MSYDDAVTDRLFFGYGLSPDGRYFYAPGSATVVDTATGHVVHTAGMEHRWGWTSPTRMSFLGDRGVTTCDAATGDCVGPSGTPPPIRTGVWTGSGLDLPVN